jgi:hypothetical protein
MPPDLSTAQPPSIQPVRPSPILYTRSPTPTTVLIAARHAAPATCTPRDKQTQFSKRNKDKEKQNKTILDSNSNLTKSMTHHNQTKELTTWFLSLKHSIMCVNLATMSGSQFPHHARVPPKTLILCIVTYGPLRFLVFPVTSIILLFLMIAHTIFGPFHFILNLTPFKHCQIFLLMLKPSLIAPSKVFSAITGVNLTISLPAPSSSVIASPCVSHVRTLHLRTGKPSVLFVLLMTLCALSCFRLAFSLLIGWRLYTAPPIYSTSAPRKPFPSPHHTLLYSEFIRISPTYGFSGANATLT